MVEALSDAPYGFAWLDIEQNPSATCGWDLHDMTDNCKFVLDLVNNLTAVGVGVGVYTSEAEWLKTVGPRCTAANFLPLWYAHFDQRDTCDDFRSFGGWQRAYAKQFSDRASASTAHCGAAVDSSVGCLTVPDGHRRWSVDAELIGLQSSSLSSGEVVVADASSGRVLTQVQDRAAASTAVASDHVGGVIWRFEEGYILRLLYTSNFTLGSHTIVNLDNCTLVVRTLLHQSEYFDAIEDATEALSDGHGWQTISRAVASADRGVGTSALRAAFERDLGAPPTLQCAPGCLLSEVWLGVRASSHSGDRRPLVAPGKGVALNTSADSCLALHCDRVRLANWSGCAPLSLPNLSSLPRPPSPPPSSGEAAGGSSGGPHMAVRVLGALGVLLAMTLLIPLLVRVLRRSLLKYLYSEVNRLGDERTGSPRHRSERPPSPQGDDDSHSPSCARSGLPMDGEDPAVVVDRRHPQGPRQAQLPPLPQEVPLALEDLAYDETDEIVD